VLSDLLAVVSVACFVSVECCTKKFPLVATSPVVIVISFAISYLCVRRGGMSSFHPGAFAFEVFALRPSCQRHPRIPFAFELAGEFKQRLGVAVVDSFFRVRLRGWFHLFL
jgi:hypothetical protein